MDSASPLPGGGTAAVAEKERRTAPRPTPPCPAPAAGNSCSSGGGAVDGRQLQSDPQAAAPGGGGCAAGKTAAFAPVLCKMAHLALPAAVPDDDPRVLAKLASLAAG